MAVQFNLFCIVCSKMTSLTTADQQSGREEMIEAFISVLDCTSEEAEFFLESSLWDIQAAVLLWFDTGKGEGDGGKRLRNHSNFDNAQPFYSRSTAPRKYLPRQVNIEGLPEGWSARVSRTDGSIVFLHVVSGHQQRSVPPGFADAVATEHPASAEVMTNDGGPEEISSLIGEDGMDSTDSINSSQGPVLAQPLAVVPASMYVPASDGNTATDDTRLLMQQDEADDIM